MADQWGDIEALHLPGLSFDPSTGIVSLAYELRGPTRTLRFIETVTLPVPERPAGLDVLPRVLELLYVAASTSYYKVAAPRRVELGQVALSGPALAWAEALYRQGLGEFAYRNDLPHVLDLDIIRATDQTDPTLGTASTASRAGTASMVNGSAGNDRLAGHGAPVVCVGGGKDSIVSIEVLRAAGFEPVLFAVNPNPIIQSVFDVSGRPVLAARRKLDPQLFALNAQGAYNGHIPVTAINSLTAVATALLGGYGPVVMSNERSASVPNLNWHGRDINHQWSKGLEAETMLRDALAAHAGVRNAYFSLLRGMSEVHIAAVFARIEAYDGVVTSCNAAFRLSGASARWCGNCDKCRFVFLALAPFTRRERLVGIFAKDMLTDLTQVPGYRELCGLTAHKPFECVGETDECLVALGLLADNPEWTDAAVVRALAAEVPAWPSAAVRADVLRGDAPNHVPPEYAMALAAMDEPAMDEPALDEPGIARRGLVRD